MFKKIKNIYCLLLFFLTVKNRKQNWFAYDILKLLPLKYVHKIQSSGSGRIWPKIGEFKSVLYGNKQVGFTDCESNACIDNSEIIENFNLNHHLFNKEVIEISNLIYFIHCYVLNPHYSYSDMGLGIDLFKNNFERFPISYNNYQNNVQHINQQFSRFLENPVARSRLKPYITTNIFVYFPKGSPHVIERVIDVVDPNSVNKNDPNINKFGVIRLRFIDFNGEHLYKISNINYKNDETSLSFVDYKHIYNFSDVINDFSIAILKSFNLDTKDVFPNKEEKTVMDMVGY